MRFKDFSATNKERCQKDFGYPLAKGSGHTPVDWALKISEEAGEVAGAVLGVCGKKKSKAHKTIHDIGEEVADLVTYCDLLCHAVGLDLGTVLTRKFNIVSDRIGSDIKLPEEPIVNPTTVAHARPFRNRATVKYSKLCGCFYCLATFPSKEVVEYVGDDDTAICPKCGINSVLGDISGFPLTYKFLSAMRNRWFLTTTVVDTKLLSEDNDNGNQDT